MKNFETLRFDKCNKKMVLDLSRSEHTGEKRRVHVIIVFYLFLQTVLQRSYSEKQPTAPSSKLKCKPHINTNKCVHNFRDYFRKCDPLYVFLL